MKEKNKKVLVAMSGGVDSSVTAVLLKNQGYDVIGVHMQLWNGGGEEKPKGRCCSTVDANDARKVCDQMDIPYYTVNAQDVFEDYVVNYFIHEYLQSRTPNPCAQCNNQIKFSYLFQKADELGCHFVATGHYSRVIQDDGVYRLYKAMDQQKDQSYFLFGCTQKALERTLMPLGAFTKSAVRELAEEFQLKVAQKPDSQEICFIGVEGYQQFIEKKVPAELRPPGLIQLADGTPVGEHQGLYRYTIGQKKGLALKTKHHDQYFVTGFDSQTQTLIVGPEKDLFRKHLIASHAHWIRPIPSPSMHCKARIRSQHKESRCQVTRLEGDCIYVKFEEDQRAITEGQAIVFYEGDEVLGGAWIDRVEPQVAYAS